jgi:hypothetical protein
MDSIRDYLPDFRLEPRMSKTSLDNARFARTRTSALWMDQGLQEIYCGCLQTRSFVGMGEGGCAQADVLAHASIETSIRRAKRAIGWRCLAKSLGVSFLAALSFAHCKSRVSEVGDGRAVRCGAVRCEDIADWVVLCTSSDAGKGVSPPPSPRTPRTRSIRRPRVVHMVDSRKSAAGHVQMRRRSRYARWRVFVVVVVGRPTDPASPVCGCILYTYCRVWQTTTIPVRTRRKVYSRRLQGRARAPTDWSICVVLAFFFPLSPRHFCVRPAVDRL